MRFPMCLIAIAVSAAGCSSLTVTNPPRTATEQFLMSSAVTEAVAQISTEALRDRVVFLDDSYFQVHPEFVQSIDRDYAISEIRARLLQGGIRLEDDVDQAQIVVEIRTGGIGVDRTDFLLGIPPLLPGYPELALLKNVRQTGYASVAYVAYWQDTGEIVASSGPFIGMTYRTDWWYMGAGPNTSGDIATAEDLN